MNHFCTYFDETFLSRGLAMMDSLKSCNKNIKFYVLALDYKTLIKLKELKKDYIKIINLRVFSNKYPELKNQKNKRKINEFCFLLTPYLIDYCLRTLFLKKIFYTDADLLFFDDCKKIISKLNKYSIISSEHNFSKKNKFQENINGKFNVGFLGFKKNATSLKCIRLWKKQCFFSTTLDDSFKTLIKGDQLYLNQWPFLYKKSFSSIRNKFFNIGAWNFNDFNFNLKRNNTIFANNKKVLMIHANFIEFENKNKIIVSNNKKLKLLNEIVCEKYIESSKQLGNKNISILKIGLANKIKKAIYDYF